MCSFPLTPQLHALGGIQYAFESKSGGDTLNSVMFARCLTWRLFNDLNPDFITMFVPRMTSVLVVTNAPKDRVQNAFVNLREAFRGIDLHEGKRPYQPTSKEAA